MSIQPVLTPAQQTVRDLIQAWRDESGIPVSQPFCETMGVAKTNGPRRQPETVLATPIRTTEQEDYPRW